MPDVDVLYQLVQHVVPEYYIKVTWWGLAILLLICGYLWWEWRQYRKHR